MRRRSGWGAPPNGHLGIGTVFPRSCVFIPGQHWPNESPERGLSVSAYHVGAGLPACSMWWSFGSWCRSLVVISSSSLGWTEVSSWGRQRKYCHHCSVMFRVRCEHCQGNRLPDAHPGSRYIARPTGSATPTSSSSMTMLLHLAWVSVVFSGPSLGPKHTQILKPPIRVSCWGHCHIRPSPEQWVFMDGGPCFWKAPWGRML